MILHFRESSDALCHLAVTNVIIAEKIFPRKPFCNKNFPQNASPFDEYFRIKKQHSKMLLF